MTRLRDLTSVDAQYPFDGPRHRRLRRSIDVPATTLFNCLADGPAWKQWLGIDVEWTSPEPHGVGTTRTVTTNGQTIEEYFLVWDDGARMSFRFDRATLPVTAFAEHYECVPTGDATCALEWSYAFEWDGPLRRLSGPVFAWLFALNGWRALRKLARLLEAEGSRWT